MNRRTFIRAASAAALATATGGSAVAYLPDTHRLQKCIIPLSLGLHRPLRAAVIGDIHFDPLYEEAYLTAVITEINRLQPDLILYTGDFVTHSSVRMHDLATILSLGQARLGAYAIPGNHDHWVGLGGITWALEKQGIHLLRNKCLALPGEDSVSERAGQFLGRYPGPIRDCKNPARIAAHPPRPRAGLVSAGNGFSREAADFRAHPWGPGASTFSRSAGASSPGT